MNKGQLIEKIAGEAELTKAQATTALNTVLGAISGALKEGDKVTLIGFGTFSANERPARLGRNPRTGEQIQISAKKVVKFKSGKELDSSLN